MKTLLLTLVLSLAAAGAVHAEKADRAKPMNVEADSMKYDDVRQSSVFTGNVVITKGTLILRASRIEVRQDAEGYQFGLAAGEPGRPAFFRQKREGVDEYIEGEAESIEYNGRADTVSFNKRAVIRRFRGATLNDETSGNTIRYDLGSDVFSVDGGPANATAANPSGRVRAMLTPRGPAAGPAAPGGPAPVLRPSTTVGGERK